MASVCGRADALSSDHKPANEVEQRRIVAAGGWVEFNRVNGYYCFVCDKYLIVEICFKFNFYFS